MKFRLCITGEAWFDIEAESEEEVKRIAEEKQKDKNLFDEMEFKKPFIMGEYPFDEEKANKEYKEFIAKYPKYEKHLKKAQKKTKKFFKKKDFVKVFSSCFDEGEFEAYIEYEKRNGLTHRYFGFGG